MGPVDYASNAAPTEYQCGVCGANGRKLWRQYQTFADHISLRCCDCAGYEQGKDVSAINADGERPECGISTDSIGWLVPAVPTEDGETYWGYTSVPRAGVGWWRRLPSSARPAGKETT